MNLDQINEYKSPFLHWELENCFDKETLNEISYSNIPSGNRAYDGTRAADHTGEGLDGKLRMFITKENYNLFPNLSKIISNLQSKKTTKKYQNY